MIDSVDCYDCPESFKHKLLLETHETGIQVIIHEYGYEVSLPHSCDRWNITSEGRHNKLETIKELDSFITELELCRSIVRAHKGVEND